MKNLVAKTKSGIEIPVSIEIKPGFQIWATALFNGKDYHCELSTVEDVPVIKFNRYSTFSKENFPQIGKDICVKLNTNWKPVVEELKKVQAQKWRQEAANMAVPEILELKHHSYYKWSILNNEIPHYLIEFHPVLSNISELNPKDFTPISSDYDDYNSWDFFTIPYPEVVDNIKKNLEIKENEEIERNHRERVKRETEEKRIEKMYVNVESVDKTEIKKTAGSDGDDLEQTVTVKMKSGRVYKFMARNIFDFGFVLNPTYIDGGGLLMNVESFIENNKFTFNSDEKKSKYKNENPTETGYIWHRYDKPSIPVGSEELEAAKVAQEETKGLTGIRM